MFFLTIIRDYIFWHYTTALVSFIRIYKNFWWFFVYYFSLPTLLKSLFSPYKQMTEPRGSVFDLKQWLGFILINVVSRIIGASIRLLIISCGFAVMATYSGLAVISYSVWLIAPLLILYGVGMGLYLIF
jgi:hypothetical protein